MLKLNDIQFGLVPYGPASGVRALTIDIGETDEVIEETLIQQVKNFIINDPKKELIAAWNLALDGSHNIFLMFKGGVIEKDEHAEEWDQFNKDYSRESINLQQEQGSRVDQMKPPFSIWYGKPTIFTSKRNFYQYFNCIYGIINDVEYGPLATQEIINHQFSAICLTGGNIKTVLDKLKEQYRIPLLKFYLIDNGNNGDDIKKLCLIAYKYNLLLEGKYFLNL